MTRTVGVSAAIALLISAAACSRPDPAPPPALADTDARLIVHGGGPGGPADACFACHGLRGEGRDLSPRLAGLDAAYLEKQLHDYARGLRTDPSMDAVAARLSDAERRAVARWYAALPALPAARAPGAEEGRALYARRCAQCHGPSGEGLGPANPALAGQSSAYLLEQLRRWKRGQRRNDGREVMTRALRGLSDRDLGALSLFLGGVSPAASAPGSSASEPGPDSRSGA